MEKEIITGIMEYCYDGVPIVRGYCSYFLGIIRHFYCFLLSDKLYLLLKGCYGDSVLVSGKRNCGYL